MQPNPYEPSNTPPTPATAANSASRLPCLNGFALGFRDGLVLSLPFVVIVAMVYQSYGASYLATAREVVVIPLIWASCAGFVAEMKYRRRVPIATDRRWIEWPQKKQTSNESPFNDLDR
ncbi:MAG: hypothetical protein J0M26_02445 [Planctomycetes bacterium]|nr:hypothetical protein [Planctomycetota bacterium]